MCGSAGFPLCNIELEIVTALDCGLIAHDCTGFVFAAFHNLPVGIKDLIAAGKRLFGIEHIKSALEAIVEVQCVKSLS